MVLTRHPPSSMAVRYPGEETVGTAASGLTQCSFLICSLLLD